MGFLGDLKGLFAQGADPNVKKAFHWSATDEPHLTRRKRILKDHPEIRDLYGREPMTAYIVLACVAMQFFIASRISEYSFWVWFAVAYAVGGTINHSMQLAAHELSHNLCFPQPWANKLLAITCNLPTGVPSAIAFQKYHMDHHQYQGGDGVDTDIPSDFEVRVFKKDSFVLKLLWVLLQPFFYALRPLFIKPKAPGFWEAVNAVVVFGVDALVWYQWGGWALGYLIAGSLLGMGLHPCAGHFIAEHYTLTNNEYETYSYLGIVNWVSFNVGYHTAHHDFPQIPWSRLKQVRKIAPEWYESLPTYNSYAWVFWQYLTDPEIGPESRIKRDPKLMTEMRRADEPSTAPSTLPDDKIKSG